MPRPLVRPILTAWLLVAAGCAEMPTQRMDAALRAGDPRAALALVKAGQAAYGPQGRLLFLMDQGALQHYAGDLSASAQTVDEAATLAGQLDAASIRQPAGREDGGVTAPYRGEHFERVLLPVLGLVDDAALGQDAAALAQARQAQDEAMQDAPSAGPDPVAYRDDALARYLAAMLHDSGGSGLDEAYRGYQQADAAFDAYGKLYATPKPQRLKADLQRVAQALGKDADLAHWRGRDGDLAPHEPLAGGAELVLLVYDGLAPVKMALPNLHFEPHAAPLPKGRLVAGVRTTVMELYEDVNAIAGRDLKDRLALGTVKGIDLRSWRSLPGRVWIARLWVPSGESRPRLYVDQGGYTQTVDLGDLTLKAGERHFLFHGLY